MVARKKISAKFQIKNRMEELNITVKSLAAQLRIPKGTLDPWLAGHRNFRPDVLAQVTRILKLDSEVFERLYQEKQRRLKIDE